MNYNEELIQDMIFRQDSQGLQQWSIVQITTVVQ